MLTNEWLESHSDAIAIVVAILVSIVPLAISATRYIQQKRDELRFRKFRIYHLLIQRLVEPEKGSAAIKLDRQIAVTFELRNFPEYYEVSVRILRGLREGWGGNPSFRRLTDEIEHTIAFMELRHGLRRRTKAAWTVLRGKAA